MSADIIRISDFDRKSKAADAASPRDPADADVIVLPVVRVERYDLDDTPPKTPYGSIA